MAETMYARIAKVLAVSATFFTAPVALGDETGPVVPDEFMFCTTCHGVQLMGNKVLEAPRLSGMETWYVIEQLENFKAGIRGPHTEDPYGYEMQPMAAVLNDKEIIAAAEFTNATRSPPPPATITGDIEKGKMYYARCANCHGDDGRGNEALQSPDLTVTNDWYLVTQMKNYAGDVRGSHPSEAYGAQMRAAARSVAEDGAIHDVVAYINSLQANKKDP